MNKQTSTVAPKFFILYYSLCYAYCLLTKQTLFWKWCTKRLKYSDLPNNRAAVIIFFRKIPRYTNISQYINIKPKRACRKVLFTTYTFIRQLRVHTLTIWTSGICVLSVVLHFYENKDIPSKTFGKIETANAIFWIYLGGMA